MLTITAVTVFSLLVVSPLTVEGLECYKCNNVTNLAGCNTLVKCQTGEVCHSEFSTIGGERWYSLGCNAAASCPPKPTIGAGSGTLVGRSVSAQDDHCSECCGTGLCNRQLCQNYDHKCEDATYCSVMGSLSNICVDVDHIKTVCQRHCGLCSLVDGGWSQWSTWSACDRTCDNGTMSRTRMCNNPVPANGGVTCAGSQQETSICSANRNCPVRGGWSQWSSWDTCSATCDIGIQGRDRACSHPHPAYGGDSCYGNGRDDRLCLPGPCADGGWSAWGYWGSCSRSCDVGLKARSRLCNNPTPSIVGRACVGDSSQSETCTMFPCQDGQWSSWSSWGSCSRSCDDGLRTRSRLCNNPVPSILGNYCVGDPSQSTICSLSPCQGPVVFYANNLTKLNPYWHLNLIFSNVTTNVGNAYHKYSGMFRAPVNGSYSFTVQLCVDQGSSYSAQVGLYINYDPSQSLMNFDGRYASCSTVSVPALLKQRDMVTLVQIQSSTNGYIQDNHHINSFSGTLVKRL